MDLPKCMYVGIYSTRMYVCMYVWPFCTAIVGCCNNGYLSFHVMCQMNMFLVQSVLKLEGAAGSQVMLFDKHPDGPYMELIEKAFSPGGPVIRPSHYRGKKVQLLAVYRMYVCTYVCIYCMISMYVCMYGSGLCM